MDGSDIVERILALIRERKILPARKVDPGLPLGARYGLDSAALIALVVAVEEEFSVDFETEDMELENFSTVGQIARLVEKKLGERPGRP